MIRKRIVALLCVSALLGICLPVAAQDASGMRRVEGEPVYESFTYMYHSEDGIVDVLSPAAYRPAFVADSASMGTDLLEPADLFVWGNEVYIADRAGSKIIITDQNFRVTKEIRNFAWKGKTEAFQNPEGLTVTEHKIYVADTGNRRIVILDKNGTCLSVITAPQSELLSSDLIFEPLKITVDVHGRIYVVIKGVYEGIMELYEDGSFSGFVGSIPVTPDPLMLFWKSIMSKEARSKLANFVPVEYTNLMVDSSGFIYATSLASENIHSIRRLNSAGSDILIRNSLGNIPVNGVYTGGQKDLSSNFVDIAADGDQLFFALDRKYGRVFAYDAFGNLLFVFGGTYTGQIGTFQKASAIAISGSRILVSDMDTGMITVFERTDYATMILKGLQLYNEDKYDESVAVWESVLTENQHYRLAYDKIGLALYQMGRYDEAMSYFQIAGDQENYSKAFYRVRENAFTDYFVWIILGGLLALIGITVLIRCLRGWFARHPVKRGGVLDSLGYVFYVLRHPFDGFWDLKHEKRGRLWVSTLLIVLTVIAFAMERSLTGFAVSADPFSQLNWGHELKLVLIPLTLFLVANMSVTSLMDGKGTFKQLYTAAGYTLTPFILVKIPLTLVSGLLTADEQMYMTLLSALAVLYVCILAFAMLSATHEYTAGKTVGVVALTGAVMVIICFICVLFFFLFLEIVSFVYTIVEEMRYR